MEFDRGYMGFKKYLSFYLYKCSWCRMYVGTEGAIKECRAP